ncbi:MAG: SDR family NAD(P)-dependent oxidoreductase [Alphaproteobacteria bacterium]
MRDFKNAVAVVTGAGSGIGRALAINLAGQGAHIAISDINKASLAETADMLAAFDVKVKADVLDITDEDGVFKYAEAIRDHFGHVNLVINNAGAALSGDFAKASMQDFKWQMDVNFWGVAYGTKAFLPILEQAEWGHIVNISSIFGIIASPSNSAYNASKFAVRGMTEALRIELDAAGSTVSCTCVHPGGVKTNIARTARVVNTNDPNASTPDELADRFDAVAKTTPEKAAQTILKGAAKNKKRVLVGGDAWLLDKIQRLMPTGYGSIIGRLLKKDE